MKMQTTLSRQELPENQQKRQMLPEQKTDQNNETFEHEWQWFLTASEHEKVWLVEMHKPKRAIGTILFVTFETLKTYENANNVIQTRASGKPTEMPSQMLPEHKTNQNNKTFEHEWQWFLKAPEHENV